MPQRPWSCQKTGDFLSELAELMRRYGLDTEEGALELADHLTSCQHCRDMFRKFQQQFADAGSFLS